MNRVKIAGATTLFGSLLTFCTKPNDKSFNKYYENNSGEKNILDNKFYVKPKDFFFFRTVGIKICSDELCYGETRYLGIFTQWFELKTIPYFK